MEILDKLEAIKNRYADIARQISDPGIMGDMKRYVKLNKDYKELEPVVNAYNVYSHILSNIKNAKEILDTEKDVEFRGHGEGGA